MGLRWVVRVGLASIVVVRSLVTIQSSRLVAYRVPMPIIIVLTCVVFTTVVILDVDPCRRMTIWLLWVMFCVVS